MSKEKYINNPDLQTAMTEYNEDMVKGREVINQYGGTEGFVTQVYDNEHGNGEQVYAVVDNPNQKPSEVKEVTVLFRGSAGPDKVLTEDFRNDWLENDMVLANRIWTEEKTPYPRNYDQSTSQLRAASDALNKIMKTYPNAKVNLYGHSLGSMNAQYAMANLSEKTLSRVNSAHIYNGPNIYSLLSDEQQEKVDAIKGKIYNYADPKDMISMVGRDISQGSEGAVGVVYYVDSQSKGFADQHMTLGYALDKEGKIKVLNTIETAALNKVYTGMETYQQLKASLSSGGLTGHEQVYLDYSQASVIAASLGTIAQEAYEQTKAIRDEAVAEAEDVWEDIKRRPFSVTHLTDEEIMAIYAEEGVTYESVVGEVTDYFDKKVKTAQELAEAFSSLSQEIETGMQAILAEDATLAGEIVQWTSGT